MFKDLYHKYKKLIDQYNLEKLIWKKAGKPIRSVERMLEIYDICSSCEHFKKDSCGICGCRLHPTDTRFPNKIAWATTECPLEEPKWTADHNGDIEISEEDIQKNSGPVNKAGIDLPIRKQSGTQQSVQKNSCGCGQRRK